MGNRETARRIIDNVLRKVSEDSYRLTYAVNILKPEPFKESSKWTIGTDGEKLFFDPKNVINNYQANGTEILEEEVFHVILHGILGHFGMTGDFTKAKLAGYVMDLQVEEIMNGLGMDRTLRGFRKPDWYSTVGFSLYNEALRDKVLSEKIRRTGDWRRIDDHALWWDKNTDPENNVSGSKGCPEDTESIAAKWEKAGQYLVGNDQSPDQNITSIINTLKDSSGRFSGKGGGTGEKVVSAEGRGESFNDILTRFLKNLTDVKEQPELIDPMLYEYGLSLNGDVPLIEPLEEGETKGLDNLVIAVDTSGSCENLIGKFLSQVSGIFEEMESYLSCGKITLLQCDYEIRCVNEYERSEEIRKIRDPMKFKGFGGTDFRPVFNWIDENLIRHSEDVDLLIYYTDAEGQFPVEKRDYPVLFVLPDKQYLKDKEIPDWIMRTAL